MLPGGNPIRHEEDAENLTSTNFTEEDHKFHPGKVVFSTTLPSQADDGYLTTGLVGDGTGGWAWLNNLLGAALFKPVIADARDRFTLGNRPR